jgi:hypothetical protein
MPKFKSNAEVEAMQYVGSNIADVVQWLDDRDIYFSIHQEMQPIEGGFDGSTQFMAARRAFVVWNGRDDFTVIPTQGWVVIHPDKSTTTHTDEGFRSMYGEA